MFSFRFHSNLAAILSTAILLSTMILTTNAFPFDHHNRIRMADLQTLTLVAGAWTTARRVPAVPQLQCIGSNCHLVHISSAQCYNRGFDGHDAQWECRASMAPQYKFGRIDVNCEGFDYPEDPYILVGSCALKYEIDVAHSGYGIPQHPLPPPIFDFHPPPPPVFHYHPPQIHVHHSYDSYYPDFYFYDHLFDYWR